ncbi:Putative heat shock protein HspR [Nocardioides aquaticus]|uniref:Heat shock protein HspR n=1 Tax=Nocardioides aquaticus TaxID=160826 RepID=A0ABX8EQT0_9ACTN|nr:MerR family transcriptional regulator [Nocardioides aquaticus]QVT81812.1 Putative heat shock protein HspR [Nocardioides aquaticus]
MPREPFAPPPPDAAVYVISVAAQLTGLHPQTLRTYERLGLVTPGRTGGGGRRYSSRDIEQLREIAELTSSGIGLEGVRRILELERDNAVLRRQAAELAAELEATRAALHQASQAGLGRPRVDAPGLPNKLPVLRPRAMDASVVVWRRGR